MVRGPGRLRGVMDLRADFSSTSSTLRRRYCPGSRYLSRCLRCSCRRRRFLSRRRRRRHWLQYSRRATVPRASATSGCGSVNRKVAKVGQRISDEGRFSGHLVFSSVIGPVADEGGERSFDLSCLFGGRSIAQRSSRKSLKLAQGLPTSE